MMYVTHPGSPKAVGTRLADCTGIATTTSTLLRHLMQPPPVTRAVQVPGVDDWSWKKCHRYGTLLVDLERRKIVEVLADREGAKLEQWLREHPAVEKVSHHRVKDYVRAVTRTAPQARQVVDRFHLVRNLSEVLQKIRLTEDPVGLTETQARLDALEQGTLADIDRPTTMGWVESHVTLAEGKVYCEFESPMARHKP